MSALPFESINLRWNPFGELTRAERAELAVFDAAPLVDHLNRAGRAIQLLGACGRGKSSYLLGLSARVEGGRYVRMDSPRENSWRTNPALRPIQSIRVLLMDEVDAVSRRTRKAWARRSSCVAWAAHQDRERELRSLGFDVLTVRVDTMIDSELLARVFARRIEFARRSPRLAVPRVSERSIERLRREHNTDVRAMERALYESFQRLSSGSPSGEEERCPLVEV